MISGVLRVALWTDRASSGSSLLFALEMSAQCCASMLRGCRATVETGITYPKHKWPEKGYAQALRDCYIARLAVMPLAYLGTIRSKG